MQSLLRDEKCRAERGVVEVLAGKTAMENTSAGQYVQSATGKWAKIHTDINEQT